ncbi:hypothetical protein [Solwaraspora sp. WMMD937]|uniref:hypothetical protein n=1 Tax=Solwaraspora sp. WMMD937 TaxID=3016090 RepID=UPI0032B3BE35
MLVLNDYETGYPIACLESSIISATRTAASAASAALRLSAARGGVPRRVGFVGTGLIAVHPHLPGRQRVRVRQRRTVRPVRRARRRVPRPSGPRRARRRPAVRQRRGAGPVVPAGRLRHRRRPAPPVRPATARPPSAGAARLAA